MENMRRNLFPIAILLLLILVSVILIVGASVPTGVVEVSDTPLINISPVDLIYLVAVVVGIFGKAAWDTINENGSTGVFVRRMLLALIVTPIVYAGVASQITQRDITLFGLAAAFQNGFFWQAVFENAQETTLTPRTNQPPSPQTVTQ